MGNWFQNLTSSFTEVTNAAAQGISSAIGGVVGGVVGGVTQGVGGGTGVPGYNYGNQGAFSPGGLGGASANIGNVFGVNLAPGNNSSSASSTSSQGSAGFFGSEVKRDGNGQPLNPVQYQGFWWYWNKPNNWRFYAIWLMGIVTILLLWWLIALMTAKPVRKKKKKATGGARI